jgi:DNA modification methylase
MNTFEIKVGDCIESMKQMEAGSVNCVVTSPPYWGLRNYGTDGQLGLEQTPEQYIENMVKVFDEVHRILADDGTLWLNIGDTYYGGGGYGNNTELNKGFQSQRIKANEAELDSKGFSYSYRNKKRDDIKKKDLVGIPWMLAFALRNRGWYLRQDIIWQKPSCMPESVKDRCTNNHEYIFLLTKNPKYYYDHEAIKEPVADASRKSYVSGKRTNGVNADRNDNDFASRMQGVTYQTRNKRSVWSISPKPFKEAHFAVFPVELIEPCILAGSRPNDTVFDPFGGAGTTAIASLKHGRNAILCEISEDYVEIANKRIDTFMTEIGIQDTGLEWI